MSYYYTWCAKDDPRCPVRKSFLPPLTCCFFCRFFQRLNDYESAIQFLVLSKCTDEAFQLARAHGKMELYADILGDDATTEDYSSLAVHFDNEKNNFLAGKFYYKAGNHTKVSAAGNTSTINILLHLVIQIDTSTINMLLHLVIQIDTSTINMLLHWVIQIDTSTINMLLHLVIQIDTSTINMLLHWVIQIDTSTINMLLHLVIQIYSFRPAYANSSVWQCL